MPRHDWSLRASAVSKDSSGPRSRATPPSLGMSAGGAPPAAAESSEVLVKAIRPSTPPEDYPDMEAVEARVREQGREGGERYRRRFGKPAEPERPRARPPGPATRPPTLEEARAEGAEAMALVDEAANKAWKAACKRTIVDYPAGHKFLPEDVVFAVAEAGFETTNAKAIGPIIAAAARLGIIRQLAELRATRSSHAVRRPLWERTDLEL